MKSFLQSPEWKEVQQKMGRKTWWIENNLIIRHDLPGGFNYLYCPRPETVTGSQLLTIADVAQKEKSIFAKVDPVKKIPHEFKSFKFSPSRSMQPRETIVLNLRKSAEELLAAMHEKTRYNTRLAERKGVGVRNFPLLTSNSQRFWNMLQETAKRDGFHTHPRAYYEKLLSVRTENFANELFFAEYRGNILAAALVNLYKPSGVATYLHGASLRHQRKFMAPHLLHWRIVQELKGQKFDYYDLGGVDEKKWPGLTRFKFGFGGEIVEYPPSIDIIYRPILYKIYTIARRL